MESLSTIDLHRARRQTSTSTAPLGKLPPHSPEAEQGVLGCILLDHRVFSDCVLKFRPGAAVFYDMRHKAIFQHMMEMHDAQEPIDIITLQQRLKDSHILDQCGGIAYLSTLPDVPPSAANLPYYADIVLEKYVLRAMLENLGRASASIYEHEAEGAELLDRIESSVLGVRKSVESTGGEVRIAALVQEAQTKIEDYTRLKGQITGISTGFSDLDKETDGLHGGDMIVLAAFPSVGKTSLAMNIAEHVAIDQKLPVGIFSLEMTSVSLVQRMMCARARVNWRNLRDGFIADRDLPKLAGAAGKIANAPLFIDDTSGLSIYQLRAKARRWSQEHGIKLFVIDYLQLLNAIGGPRQMENRQQEVADISKGVKEMAKELNAAVIVLSQLNEEGKLRESRAIGQDLDTLWDLRRSGDTEPGQVEKVDLWIPKQRNGPRDVKIPFSFLPWYTRFELAAKISDDDVPQQSDMI